MRIGALNEFLKVKSWERSVSYETYVWRVLLTGSKYLLTRLKYDDSYKLFSETEICFVQLVIAYLLSIAIASKTRFPAGSTVTISLSNDKSVIYLLKLISGFKMSWSASSWLE